MVADVTDPTERTTDRFEWNPAEQEFVAQASALGAFVGRFRDDAPDVGFALVSHRTGRRELYSLLYEEYDEADKLASTVFVSLGEPGPRVRVFP